MGRRGIFSAWLSICVAGMQQVWYFLRLPYNLRGRHAVNKVGGCLSGRFAFDYMLQCVWTTPISQSLSIQPSVEPLVHGTAFFGLRRLGRHWVICTETDALAENFTVLAAIGQEPGFGPYSASH